MPASSELIGTKLGRYTLIDHLATGGMAEIFLARQESLGKFRRDLVLKVLQTRWEEYPEVVDMFLEEARISALMRHPNIVDVFDVAAEGGRHYIVMEYIAGRTLAELAKRAIQVTKSISIEVGAYIAAEMASALAYMYDGQGGMGEPFRVIHRDVSPTNILISTAGQVKLIDFGIARQGNITPDSRARPGKFTYMSPEQVKNEAMDGRSDIFCLGTILYEITLGRRLWRGTREAAMKRIVDERPRPPTFIRRDYPTELELIVLRALEKKPEDRYQSAAELHNDLQGFLMRSRAHLRSHFHMADYVAKIFSEEAEALISDAGRRRAQEFVDNTEVLESDQTDLDFDAERAAGPGAALARALRASALGVWAEPAPPAEEPAARAEAAKVEEAPAAEPAATPAGAPDQAAAVRDEAAEAPADGPVGTPSSTKPAHGPDKPGTGAEAKETAEADQLPRRWGPMLVAAIVLLAVVGALWWLRGQ
ncbi:MAG: serine/threonine protein kinase [Deltaproteobacteria bacterium]|nr:serine/threonine protein kinase [Deltaproteobacteria bacterium]